MAEILPGNGLQTALASDLGAAATTLSIAAADAPKWPVGGEYRAVVCQDPAAGPWEIVRVTGGQGTSSLVVERAAEPYNGDQSARAWTAGATVAAVITQESLQLAAGGISLPLTQDLTFSPDNTYDVGAVAVRPRTLWAGTSVVVGSDADGVTTSYVADAQYAWLHSSVTFANQAPAAAEINHAGRFSPNYANTTVSRFSYYRASTDTGPTSREIAIYQQSDSALLWSGSTSGEVAGWNHVAISPPLALTVGTWYFATFHLNAGAIYARGTNYYTGFAPTRLIKGQYHWTSLGASMSVPVTQADSWAMPVDLLATTGEAMATIRSAEAAVQPLTLDASRVELPGGELNLGNTGTSGSLVLCNPDPLFQGYPRVTLGVINDGGYTGYYGLKITDPGSWRTQIFVMPDAAKSNTTTLFLFNSADRPNAQVLELYSYGLIRNTRYGSAGAVYIDLKANNTRILQGNDENRIGIGSLSAPTDGYGVYVNCRHYTTSATFSTAFAAKNTQNTVNVTDADTMRALAPGANGAGVTITNMHGLRVENQGGTGRTNAYGVHIAAQSGASASNIGLYNAGSTTLVGPVTLPNQSVGNDNLKADTARANLLTNGGFRVWQRGTGPFTAVSGAYYADRWQAAVGAGGTLTIYRTQDGTGPPGDPLAVMWNASYTHSSGETACYQQIKMSDADLRGRTVTCAMWIRSSIDLSNGLHVYTDGSGGQNLYVPVPTTNTWHRLTSTINIPTNATFIYVGYYTSASLAGVYITGATLVPGSVAADYAPLHPADDLARCLRYYEPILSPVVNGQLGTAQNTSPTAAYASFHFKVKKAVAPSVTYSGGLNITNAAGGILAATPATAVAGFDFIQTQFTVASGLVAGNAAMVIAGAANGGIVIEANP